MTASKNAHFRQARKLARQGELVPAIEAFERALAELPDDPTILFEIGQVAKLAGMFEIAIEMFKKVIAQQPDALEAWNNLGNVQLQAGRYPEGVQCLERAVELGGERAQLLCNLGLAYWKSFRPEEAIAAYRRALAVDPKYAGAHAGLADMLTAHQQFAAAVPHFERTIKLTKNARDREQTRFNMALAQINCGQLGDGWDNYEARLHPQVRNLKYNHNIKPYKGGDLAGRAILVTAEQGLGDQIEFAAILPRLIAKAGTVHVAVEVRLVALFERSFPDAVIHTYKLNQSGHNKVMDIAWRDAAPKIDWALPIGSLAKHFCRDAGSLRQPTPYLFADPGRRAHWRARINEELGRDRPKIGLCWRSGKLSGDRWRFYNDLLEWRDLLALDGIDFVNLQYDGGQEEIAQVEKELGIRIHHFDDLDQTVQIDETSALIAEMDFVVSAGTVVSQLGGALGVPSLKTGLSPFMCGYRPMPFQPAVWPVYGPGKFAEAVAAVETFRDDFARLDRDALRQGYNERPLQAENWARKPYMDQFQSIEQ